MLLSLTLSLLLTQADVPEGTVTKSPQLVTFVEAVYPPGAADAGVTGVVTMTLDLDATGQVENVVVVESPRW